MNYYIQQNEKIVLFDENKQRLQNTLLFTPQYQDLEIQETTRKIIQLDNEFVFEDEVQEELKEQRKQLFENQFLTTSLGNYRLQPKGYANAQQSIDTINNIVMSVGGLTEDIAKMIIFYDTPDFSKEEECTEEWLVAHQHNPEPMTKEQWVQFYIEFTQLYIQCQHQQLKEVTE